MRFFLGTHLPNWLDKISVPLFVSARTLRRSGKHIAKGSWALDSGGFTEISMHGRWMTPPEQYAEETEQWSEKIGGMRWAAVQDWMCEPFMLKRTGLTVESHQRRTIISYQELNDLKPLIHWLPVLQGYTRNDYVRHYRMYKSEGIDLRDCPVVGLGSVCRRQATGMVESLARDFCEHGVKLHGFGLKIEGLRRSAKYFTSADSLAWSRGARYQQALPGCEHSNCANCMRYALRWRKKVLAAIEQGMK